MEFSIDLAGTRPDPVRLDALLADHDPSATGDLDGTTGTWRVNTVLQAHDLVVLLADAGLRIPLMQVTLVPSVCCGGCSG